MFGLQRCSIDRGLDLRSQSSRNGCHRKDENRKAQEVEDQGYVHEPGSGRKIFGFDVGYRVDQRETIADPTGFRGKTLAGDFFCNSLTASSTAS